MKTIILASASPRRKSLLSQAGYSCQVVPSLIEEKITTEIPWILVQELSRQKCEDVAARISTPGIVLGADTVVASENRIFGKPKDASDAAAMLKSLQGGCHQVYTGVTLIWRDAQRILREETFYEKTEVEFYPMDDAEIKAYVETQEPLDKAGAYGIQGRSAVFIKRIIGDYNNVVGLPLAAFYQRLKRCGEETDAVVCALKRVSAEKSRYRIRGVRETDLKMVAQIEAECFPAAEAASYADFVERYRSCKNSFFVAETEDGRLAGFCNGCCTNQEELTDDLYHSASGHDENGTYQMIFGLDTLTSYQGQGIGQALMKHMIENAKKSGKKAVILTCKEHMIPFYQRIGYQFAGLADSNHGGAVWYKMIYSF